MRPRRREIARWPDRKIARLVDDLEVCPRLASTAMSALRQGKHHDTARPQPRNGQPGLRPSAPAAQLVSYYAAHHAQVLAGGMLLGLSGIFFVLFGLAVWARIRQAQASPLLGGLALIATTLVTMTTLAGAGVYGVLG